MARIFIDGFESGSLDLWDDSIGSEAGSSAGLGMDGSYCCDAHGLEDRISKVIESKSELYVACRYRFESSSAKPIMTFRDNSDEVMYLQRNKTSGLIEVRLKKSESVVATGTTVTVLNTTYLVEFHVKIHGTDGVAKVKINGLTDVNFAGNTLFSGDHTTFNKVTFGYSGDFDYSYAYFDNIIFDDSEFPGDSNICGLKPTAVGNLTEWTPSVGSNFDCVDEIPPSDTDYVSTNIADKIDTYVMSDSVSNLHSIKCVQAHARVESDGTPTPTHIQLAVRPGTTDHFSANKDVPTEPVGISHIWETNPDNSAAWVKADVDGMEAGIKSKI